MEHTRKIHTIDLFPDLDKHLIELLSSLTPDEWQKPTVSKLWVVKDIAAHLLDGNIRQISMKRDAYFSPDAPARFENYGQLVAYLNSLNADWVKASRRISPALLVCLLESTNKEVYTLLKQLDMDAPALFAVAWAGDEMSPNWFDIAREYTEKWHHQQQIRHAVNKPGIMSRKLYYPFLDTVMRALPINYKSIFTREGTVLQFTVTGEAGGSWFLLRKREDWLLIDKPAAAPSTQVNIAPEIAWRLFSKGIDKEAARAGITVSGDTLLGNKVLDMVAVMA